MKSIIHSGTLYLTLTGKIEEEGVKEMGVFSALSISIFEVSIHKS